jgi:metal-responsive CopG/Arc/MetJ family transcriptional regulator
MKTIAISIDQPTLDRIDNLLSAGTVLCKSRSEIIRQAVHAFVAHLERMTEEDREREIFRQHRGRLNRQATALVKEQAKL